MNITETIIRRASPYKAVAFDLKRLYEYDPDGVTKFMLLQFRP